MRSLPWICSVGQLYLGSWLYENQVGSHLTGQILVFGILGIGILALLGLWIVPLVRSRGALPYDRMTGLRVVRKTGAV